MSYLKNIDSSTENKELYIKNEKFPPSLIVDTVNYCNLSCTCCGRGSGNMTRKKGIMKIDLFKKIINEIAYEDPYTELWMAFYGEPLILKYKLIYMISYAKKKGLKNIFLNTNGILLDSELSEALLDAGLDKIVFSLDAYYEETYYKIRNNKNFKKVKKNIVDFIAIKNRMNSPIKVEVQLIEIPGMHKEGEIQLFKELWESYGVYSKIKPYVTWMGALDIKGPKDKLRHPCSWLFKTCVVLFNGDVNQCGCDYDGKYIAGNIVDTSIKHIWRTNLKDIRDIHLEGEYTKTPICSNCSDWKSYSIMPFLIER